MSRRKCILKNILYNLTYFGQRQTNRNILCHWNEYFRKKNARNFTMPWILNHVGHTTGIRIICYTNVIHVHIFFILFWWTTMLSDQPPWLCMESLGQEENRNIFFNHKQYYFVYSHYWCDLDFISEWSFKQFFYT